MIDIVAERAPRVVRQILEQLPDWFGDPQAIDNYEVHAADDEFASLVAREGGQIIGVALIARHFQESAELHLIAVTPAARGRGVGRALTERACLDLTQDGCRFLTVHTVGASFEHDGYRQTRAFYQALGFTPLEEHSGLDWAGPTLILARSLT